MKFIALAMLAAVTTSHATATDPLSEFEEIVAQCRHGYSAPVLKTFFQPSVQKWVKRIDQPDSFKYDVKRTDSLVSPLMAYIQASTLGAAEFAETEDQASSLQPSVAGKASRSTVRYEYAHRGGKWTFVGATETTAWRDSENSSFREPMSIKRTRDSLQKERLPWALCVSPNSPDSGATSLSHDKTPQGASHGAG